MLALNVTHPLSYIGSGPTGGGQIINSGLGGPLSKQLWGVATIINDTTASGTTCPIGYIDGTQSLGKQVVLQLQSVDAPVTYLGTANTAMYHSVGADSQLTVGQSVIIAGFTTSANNVTATVTFVLNDRFGVTNASSVAEINPAGTAKWTIGGTPFLVQCYLAQGTGDSAAAVTLAAAKALFATTVTDTGFVLNFPTLTTAAAQITVGCVLNFSA